MSHSAHDHRLFLFKYLQHLKVKIIFRTLQKQVLSFFKHNLTINELFTLEIIIIIEKRLKVFATRFRLDF